MRSWRGGVSEKKKSEWTRSCAEARRRRGRELKAKLDAYKAARGCLYCDENDPVCLDFDHRERTEKLFTIATALRDVMSWPRVFSELQKCDVVCANCHRKRHGGRRLIPRLRAIA
jgi:hypothetical protein